MRCRLAFQRRLVLTLEWLMLFPVWVPLPHTVHLLAILTPPHRRTPQSCQLYHRGGTLTRKARGLLLRVYRLQYSQEWVRSQKTTVLRAQAMDHSRPIIRRRTPLRRHPVIFARRTSILAALQVRLEGGDVFWRRGLGRNLRAIHESIMSDCQGQSMLRQPRSPGSHKLI